ncbi:MAG: ATP-binding protein [Candidatus Electrothrix sp. ATG2]|nr:ATP-binding protein [Candidatus Electrothrix sp. ATG2]
MLYSSPLLVHVEGAGPCTCPGIQGRAQGFAPATPGITKKKGETIEISVLDSGIGIATEDQPRLFEAFERLDSHLRVKAGGTGLGLYLTKKIVVELLQGEVFMESCPSRGSTFGLRIPATLSSGGVNS